MNQSLPIFIAIWAATMPILFSAPPPPDQKPVVVQERVGYLPVTKSEQLPAASEGKVTLSLIMDTSCFDWDPRRECHGQVRTERELSRQLGNHEHVAILKLKHDEFQVPKSALPRMVIAAHDLGTLASMDKFGLPPIGVKQFVADRIKVIERLRRAKQNGDTASYDRLLQDEHRRLTASGFTLVR